MYHQIVSLDSQHHAAPSAGNGIAWYALWVRSRHERTVQAQLDEKRVVSFLPTVPKWSHWKDRRKRIDWPLFPGYCFARFDPSARLSILRCAGVVSIVSMNGELSRIPDVEIQGIRHLIESQLAFDACPFIREGMMVEVVRGPLRGVVGRLIRKSQRAQLMVCVELINQAVSVHVDPSDVEPY